MDGLGGSCSDLSAGCGPACHQRSAKDLCAGWQLVEAAHWFCPLPGFERKLRFSFPLEKGFGAHENRFKNNINP